MLEPSAAGAMPPKYFSVSNTRIETRGGTITARLAIGFDNVAGLFDMLKDGAAMELMVKTRLERVRALWSNVVLAERTLVSTLQHNPLTREFSLRMPGESSPLIDKNLDRLLEATWRKFFVPLGSASLLEGGQGNVEYRIVLTLALQHAKMPPWLTRNFVLWSKNVVEPETVVLPFYY